ncbi:MAG TPA: ABC transporter permease [Terracidiphilus sp.]
MPIFFRDLHRAARQLRHSPGFSLAVILILALGIGATTAMFSLIEAILLRPLPFADPDRLVMLGEHIGSSPSTGVTARDIRFYTQQTSAFSSMGGYATFSFELSGGERPEQVDAGRFNASVFTTLGVPPALGRVFSPQEEDAHQLLAVISYRLWQNRFHRDPRVMGTSITLDRQVYTVIGVMPRSFEFPLGQGTLHPTELWIPLSSTPLELAEKEAGNFRYQMVARMKDGLTLRQAAEDADLVSRRIMENYPATMHAIHIRGDVTPLREFFIADVRPALRALFLAVGMVLLVACVNAAGLFLVRSIRRRRDIAVRLALGARSGAIVREAIFEGMLLSGIGAVAGLLVVALAVRSAPQLLPESMPRIEAIAVDPAVAGFAILLALATGVLSSLAPAFSALRTNMTNTLKEGAKTATTSHAWLRSTFVVIEIAAALVLLNVSVAFVRSYEKMLSVDPGFRPDNVLVAGYLLPLPQYPTGASVEAFNRAVTEKLAAAPGVTAVGIGSSLPALGLGGGSAYTVEGEPVNQWKLKFSMFNLVDGDYFPAMGIPLRDGRLFTDSDRADTPAVVIVNESMAKHCWPGQRAVGKRLHGGNPQKGLPWATVVGVVADTKGGARDQPDGDQWYIPLRQPAILFGNDYKDHLTNAGGGYLVVRSTFAPEQMTRTMRATVAKIDSRLALEPIQPMNAALANVEAPRRFNTELISGFAIGALLLAISGIYAVVAFSVSLRAQEIAIRLALGAQRDSIARLVLVSGAKLGLAGCVLGVLATFAASRLVTAFLFEISATDPFIYAAGVAIILLCVLLASALPAARAAAADPIQSLRTS